MSPLTGEDDEWDINYTVHKTHVYQNNRNSAVFKEGKDGKAYYINAIIFKDNNGICSNSQGGGIKLKNGKTLSSRQYIRNFPFTPKSFYIDVVQTERDKTDIHLEGLVWQHTYDIKDENQLKEVFELYENPNILFERLKKIKKIKKNI